MFRFDGDREKEKKIMKNVDTVKEQLAELSKSNPKLKASQSFRCDKLLQKNKQNKSFNIP